MSRSPKLNAPAPVSNAHTPASDCMLCPRLVQFRHDNQVQFPDKFNAPVPSFGGIEAELLIVGLAPGLKGANFTGRPFTGDYAGDTLYDTLVHYGFATGVYDKRPDDGLTLINCRITNAVRCVPPENKPTTPEAEACRPFLIHEIQAMKNLRVLMALGSIAHNAVLKTFNLKQSQFKFAHNTAHQITDDLVLIDSYHCSRYNVNTGRLTQEMFNDIFDHIRRHIPAD